MHQQVLQKLRERYPYLNIIIYEKEDKGQLLANDKKILRYNPELLEKQLEAGGEPAVTDFLKLCAEYIEKKYIMRKNKYGIHGRPARNFSESQIRYANSMTRSCAEAARFLNVSYSVYSKYAKMHNLFESHKNFHGRGIPKGFMANRLIPLQAIFAGLHPNYDVKYLKARLIKEMILEEKCSVCGYHERRVMDNKVSLILDFLDENKHNRALENMRFLCYNCTFNIRGSRIGKNAWNAYMQSMAKENQEYIDKKTEQEHDDLWSKFNPTQ